MEMLLADMKGTQYLSECSTAEFMNVEKMIKRMRYDDSYDHISSCSKE